MDYTQLVMCQKARLVTKEIKMELRSWPKTMQAQEISRQLFRAASSVGANIAVGHGRHLGREYTHYLMIAQDSANEVDHWIQTAMDCLIGDKQDPTKLRSLNNETRRMLTAAVNTLRTRSSQK